MAGVETVKMLLKDGVALVNMMEQVKAVDLKKVVVELLDMDKAELVELAKEVGMLDLTNDVLEAKVKQYVAMGVEPMAFVLAMLRLVLPKASA